MSDRLAYGVDDAAEAAGLTADELRELIASEEVRAFSFRGKGKRLIATADLEGLIRRGPRQVLERIRAQPVNPDDAPAQCGVYILVLGGAIAYVGRSIVMKTRVQQHRAAGREFDEVRAIPCDNKTAIWLEQELIRTLKPSQNLTRFLRRACATEKRIGHIR